jgi:putative membrane protein
VTAPVLVHDLEDATWHRLSPRMLLIHPVIEVGRALPAILGVFVAGSSQGHNYWGLAATGAVALYSLTRWFTTRLRITADQVQLREGLLRRRTITAARDRIRTVDVTAHVLHRALGLARVVIGTGTNDRKREGRLVVDGLPAATAAGLRADLLHRPARGPEPAGHSPVDAAAGPEAGDFELARLDPRWIRYAPFTLSGVLTGLVIWGFYWRIQGESGIDLARTGPLHAVIRTLHRLPTAEEVAVVVGALLAFVAVTSTVGYVLAYWNFRLLRHDGGSLQVTRGLLTTRATSIERRRLVGVTVSEPLLLRTVGAARLTAVATGLRTGRGSERGGEVLLPPAPRGVVDRAAGQVLDGAPALGTELRPHGPAAARRRLVRAVAPGGLLTVAAVVAWRAGAPGWPVVIAAGIALLGLPLGFDRAAALGHARTGGYLATRSGSLVRRRTVLAEPSIIGWNLRSTYFQRRLGLVTMVATTAAGHQGYRVVDVPAEQALELAREITPELVRPFRRAPRATSR